MAADGLVRTGPPSWTCSCCGQLHVQDQVPPPAQSPVSTMELNVNRLVTVVLPSSKACLWLISHQSTAPCGAAREKLCEGPLYSLASDVVHVRSSHGVSRKDVGLNTDEMDRHAVDQSQQQSKSLATPPSGGSSQESSRGHSLTFKHRRVKSRQVFPTSSSKHPGEEKKTFSKT